MQVRHTLEEALQVKPVISQILLNREIADPEEAWQFLHPALKDLHNPFLMKDIEKGVDRLIKAIFGNERIAIYGDYDADGITSVVVLVKFISQFYNNITHYIPDRIKEGYGLNTDAIDALKHDGVSLIITVDCGTTDHDEIRHAKSLDVDTIVLDHHEVPERLPDAVAMVNPNRIDCAFPFKHLAGVGIVFNFIIALRGKLRNVGFWNNRIYPNLKEYLDLVAIGTIGDIAPLIDENRIFAKIGLEVISQGKRHGIRALKIVSGLNNSSIDSKAASFQIIPRINAAGRVGSPEDAVQLLLTDNPDKAMRLAGVLDTYNRQRQEIERNIIDEIFNKIDEIINLETAKSIVLASPSWHPGVIGIVASRVVDKYYRPTILISLNNGVGKGSGRSITSFNLYNGLKESCDPFLISYGGHQYAAGITIREENIEEFSHAFNKAVRDDVGTSDLIPLTFIDAECNLHDITYELLHQIEMLAPFGNRNPEPVLCVKNIKVASSIVVGTNHLRMRVNEDYTYHDSIWFGMGHVSRLLPESEIDIAFTPQFNNWNGLNNIQLKMIDISLTGSP